MRHHCLKDVKDVKDVPRSPFVITSQEEPQPQCGHGFWHNVHRCDPGHATLSIHRSYWVCLSKNVSIQNQITYRLFIIKPACSTRCDTEFCYSNINRIASCTGILPRMQQLLQAYHRGTLQSLNEDFSASDVALLLHPSKTQ